MKSRFEATRSSWRGKGLEISCDRNHAVSAWLCEVLAEAPRSSLRDVLVRLVGALLRVRPGPISRKLRPLRLRQPATSCFGDFKLGHVSYHVADVPASSQLYWCKRDLGAHRFPVLLVPRSKMRKAYLLAGQAGIRQRLTIFALEDFFSHRVLFQALDQRHPPFAIWESIIRDYNRRIETTSVPAINLK